MPGRRTSKQERRAARADKSFRLASIADCYDALVKDQAGRDAYHADAAVRRAPDPSRMAHVDRPPPASTDVSTRKQSERRKFPRKPKPTIQMKPVSNDEYAAHLRSGTYSPASQKSLRWLAALKALSTGYSKTSGGGALKASNRGRSMPLLGPSGRTAGKPGGHYRTRRLSGRANFGPDGRPGPKGDRAKFKQLRRALVVSPFAEVAVERSSDSAGVVLKSEGAEMSSNVDFKDLFKSELASDHLVDCPHCDAPITKSDLAKGRGKGKAMDVGGAKRGKSSTHVRDHNPEGGTMRGGDGRGVHAPSRGVPGASKTDAVVGVQNDKGSNARKGGDADSSVEEGEDDVDKTMTTTKRSKYKKREFVHVRGGEMVSTRLPHMPQLDVGMRKKPKVIDTKPGTSKAMSASDEFDDSSGDDAEPDDVDKSEHGFKEGQSVIHNPSADKNAAGTPGKVGGRSTGTHVHFVGSSGKGRMVPHDEIHAASAGSVKKSVTIRGTDWVQYVDDGSDAALAKSIAEGRLGGTSPTRPLDLNNDLTRLLI